MSAEIIAIIINAVGLLLTLGGTMVAGFAWCFRRSDGVELKLGARIDGVRADLAEVERSLGARVDGVRAELAEVERSLGARVDGARADLAEVERSLGARIDAVAGDTTDLKVVMARLEGPQRHLIVAAR